uniref:UTP14C small subunit processome component n=1 Tax=Setaria digitata TaxID=48799 RepID=A0A915PJH5_9BILA
MSDVDSDFDEGAHTKLLNTINSLGSASKKEPLIRKCPAKVRVQEMVDLIRSTRNVDDVKKKLVSGKKRKGKLAETDKPKTLLAPSHRLARERIESSIAYSDIRRDLGEWDPIVKKNRLAEQLVFPLVKDPPLQRIASDMVLFFKPRTPLEIELAKLLGTSKNNLHDDEEYTEAEMELIRAMSLKEAKAKWAQLKKMRALVGYREAKLKRQAKIKSKSYHRHMKRQKRKQLIKEFEEMMTKDPEAAKEKLEEIDRQRILERATLKHRNGGKGIQQLTRYASKNKDFKKIYEDQIRLGRELAEKHGREKDSDSASESEGIDGGEQLSVSKVLQKAVDELEKEERGKESSKQELRIKLNQMRKRKREILRKSIVRVTDSALISNQEQKLVNEKTDKLDVANEKDVQREEETKEANKEHHQPDVLNNAEEECSEKRDKKQSEKDFKNLKKKKSSKRRVERMGGTDIKDLDTLFDKAEKNLAENVLKECKFLKIEDGKGCDRSKPPVISRQEKAKKVAKETEERVVDISLDPKHFLQVETRALPQISADFVETLEDSSEGQEAIIAKAFEDVDVIGDFETQKEAVEAAESPKDIDLTLQGWGSWTGPGINDKKKDRFVIRAEKKKRKDTGKAGLIISETVDSSMEKIQLRSVPFPYTTVEDYEAVVRQPLGKEWNPQRIFRKLTQPQIITKAGRIIKPLDRSMLDNEAVEEKSDSELL